MKRKILFILYIMLWVTACTESGMLENDLWTSSKYQRFLNIAAGNVTLDASGETSYVNVEAITTSWEFSKLESWLTISPLSGQSDTRVSISATQNPSGDDVRTCVVSLNSTANDYNFSKSLTITQAAATPFINLSKSSVALPAIGGTETINVETNIRYTTSVSSLVPWLTVESAPDMKSLTITAPPNVAAEERSASVVLNGKISQTIKVTQANEIEYVDLGLPSGIKWAAYNVGATKPEEYGNYYAWGETEPKSSYTEENYIYKDNPSVLPLDKDAAHVNWGDDWRMPNKTEQDELRNSCTWTWETRNGVWGYSVTSKVNGNSIFLPAAGYRRNGDLLDAVSYGNYWSSTRHENNSNGAYGLGFRSGYWDCLNYRSFGHSVRAVCP